MTSFFVNRRDCAGLRTASAAFATCVAEVSSALVRPKVLVWVGRLPSVQAVDVFDPASVSWATFPTAQECRSDAASAVISGRLYVCRGHSGPQSSTSSSLDCFDPVPGLWQSLPPMSQRRSDHVAAVIGARLYVCGGWQGGQTRKTTSDAFWCLASG